MTSSGGKNVGPPAPGLIVQPLQALLEETFAPFGDNLPGQVQTLPDRFVFETLGGKEDNLGANNITIR
jgi:hypothetical protein